MSKNGDFKQRTLLTVYELYLVQHQSQHLTFDNQYHCVPLPGISIYHSIQIDFVNCTNWKMGLTPCFCQHLCLQLMSCLKLFCMLVRGFDFIVYTFVVINWILSSSEKIIIIVKKNEKLIISHRQSDRNEWMSNCCLIPHQNFFPLFHGENKLHFNDAEDVFQGGTI